MPYALTKKQGYVHLDWSGTMTADDLKSIGPSLAEVMAEWGRVPHVLHTFDRVEGMDFGPWAMFAHSVHREDTRIPWRSKSAHVAKTETARTVCKMVCELNRNPNIEMKLFSDEAEAVAWLCSEEPAPHRNGKKH